MENTVAKIFGKVLREVRKAKGFSQQELADNCNIERTYISRIERGLHLPSLEAIFKICEVLKVDPATLIKEVYSIYKSKK